MRTVLIATMRNEGMWLLEWVAYHHAIGFEDIWIYSNDNEDGSDELLDALAQIGVIRHTRNPVKNSKLAQLRAYERAYEDPDFKAYEWAGVLDADEYLVFDEPDLSCFLGKYPKASILGINWKMFGGGFQKEWRRKLVIERFLDADPSPTGYNRRIKSLFRPAKVQNVRIHCPDPTPGSVGPANPSGTPITRNTALVDHRSAQVNHYVTKSVEESVIKAARGGAGKDASPAHLAQLAEHYLRGGHIDKRALARRADQKRLMGTYRENPRVRSAEASIVAHFLSKRSSPPRLRSELESIIEKKLADRIGWRRHLPAPFHPLGSPSGRSAPFPVVYLYGSDRTEAERVFADLRLPHPSIEYLEWMEGSGPEVGHRPSPIPLVVLFGMIPPQKMNRSLSKKTLVVPCLDRLGKTVGGLPDADNRMLRRFLYADPNRRKQMRPRDLMRASALLWDQRTLPFLHSHSEVSLRALGAALHGMANSASAEAHPTEIPTTIGEDPLDEQLLARARTILDKRLRLMKPASPAKLPRPAKPPGHS